MAYGDKIDERVHIFNLERENSRLAEIYRGDKEKEDIEWETYSIEEVQKLLKLSEDEARKLVKSGLFKTYRVGNEYRASRKSVEERKKTVDAMLTYQNQKTMSVPDLRRILGLGKTSTYRLVNQCYFKTYVVFGKMRIDVESFEKWYAGQFHYKKVNGERPGTDHIETIAPTTIAKVLGVSKSTAYDFLNNGEIEFIVVKGKRRVIRQSFEDWYASQNRFKMIKTIEEVENYVD